MPGALWRALDGYGLGTDPDALPGAAAEPNDAPSGVSLSEASTLLATNLVTLNLARSQLRAWNDWAAKQQEAMKPPEQKSWWERNFG